MDLSIKGLLALAKTSGPVLGALVLLALGYFATSQLLAYLTRSGTFAKRITDGLRRIMRYGVLLLLILLLAQVLGLGIGSIWTFITTTLAMVAVGFVAVWSVISNVLCAVLLVSLKPFRIGDSITIMDTASPEKELSGVVININWFYTSLRSTTHPDSVVLVPNTVFFQKYVRLQSARPNAAQPTASLGDQLFVDNSLLAEEKAQAGVQPETSGKSG